MTIELNGEPHECPAGTTVAQLLASVTGSLRGSAVVVDGEVVPRGSWPAAVLREGQSVQVITAVQGG